MTRRALAPLLLAAALAACGPAPRPAISEGEGIPGIAATPVATVPLASTAPSPSPSGSAGGSGGPSGSASPGASGSELPLASDDPLLGDGSNALGWPAAGTSMRKYCAALISAEWMRQLAGVRRSFLFTNETTSDAAASNCAWRAGSKGMAVSLAFLSALRGRSIEEILSFSGVVVEDRLPLEIPGAEWAELVVERRSRGIAIITNTPSPFGPMILTLRGAARGTDLRAIGTEILTSAIERMTAVPRTVYQDPPPAPDDAAAFCARVLDPTIIRYHIGLPATVEITPEPPTTELGGYLLDCRWRFSDSHRLVVGIYRGSNPAIITALRATIPAELGYKPLVVPGTRSALTTRLGMDHFALAYRSDLTVIMTLHAEGPGISVEPPASPTAVPSTPGTAAPSTASSARASASPSASPRPSPSPTPAITPAPSAYAEATPRVLPGRQISPANALRNLMAEIFARLR